MRGYIAFDVLELTDNARFRAAVSIASPVPWFASDGERPLLTLAGELDGKVCLTPLFHAVRR